MRFAGYPSGTLEAQVVDDLVDRLRASGCWFVYREVAGRYPDGHPGEGRPRADVLAVPNGNLIAGPMHWAEGVVAFECKRPGISVESAVDQVVGYKGAAWSLPGNVEVVARSWWLWPMPPQAQVGERQLRIRMHSHGIGLGRVGDGPRLYQLGNVMGGCPLLTVTRTGAAIRAVYNPSARHKPGVSHGWHCRHRS